MGVRRMVLVGLCSWGVVACLYLGFQALCTHEVRFPGHTGPVREAVCSPDGEVLVSTSRDNTLRFWDVATGKERATLQEDVDAVRFSPDGKTLATLSQKTGKLKL